MTITLVTPPPLPDESTVIQSTQLQKPITSGFVFKCHNQNKNVPNFRIKNPKVKAPKIPKKCTLGQGTSLTLKILKNPKNINVLQGTPEKT